MNLPLRLAVVLLTPATLAAQAEPWLSEIPTAQRVATELQAGTSRMNSVRAAAAMFSIKNIFESLLYVQPPRPPSAAASARLAEIMAERERISNIQYEKDRETYKFERCKAMVDENPEFHRELLDRFFSAAWITAYGPRLDPRRWKAPLALPVGTRMTSSPHPDCGPMTVAVAPAPVEARLPAAVAAVAPTPRAPVAAAGSPSSGAVSRMLTQGNQLVDAKRYGEARKVLDSAVRLEPRNARALYLLGLSLQGMNLQDSTLADLWGQADSLYQVALALEMRDAELLVDLGDALSEFSGQDEAYRRALALNPPPKVAARAHEGLGWFYHFLSMYNEAIPEFRAAVRLDPPNPAAVYAIGWQYVRLKQLPQARAIHRQLLGIDATRATRLLKHIDEALKPTP